MKEYKEILCPESNGLNGGLHLIITSSLNDRRKICLMCSEIIDDNKEKWERSKTHQPIRLLN